MTPTPEPARPLPPRPLLLAVLAGLGMVGPFTIDTIFPAFAQMAVALIPNQPSTA